MSFDSAWGILRLSVSRFAARIQGEVSCQPIVSSARSRTSGTPSIASSPATAARASTTRKSSPRPGSAGRTASPITFGRRRAFARSSRPALAALEIVEQPALRHHHLKSARLTPSGDPITGRVPIFTNADVTLWRCRPAQPQAELYRNAAADEMIFVHKGRGTLHHAVRRVAVQAVRLHRHSARHHLSARVRPGHRAGSAGHRVEQQHRHSAALSQSRWPNPAGRSLLRARLARADRDSW